MKPTSRATLLLTRVSKQRVAGLAAAVRALGSAGGLAVAAGSLWCTPWAVPVLMAGVTPVTESWDCQIHMVHCKGLPRGPRCVILRAFCRDLNSECTSATL